MNKYIKISEVSKIMNLIDPVSKKPLNYILRYWEREFKERILNLSLKYVGATGSIISVLKYPILFSPFEL